ncbi:F-box protein PP2-A13-like [Bidens hawaiensis]|uniref:F-box protein PP2-A13-like n=1 Tax=Bidens hawaiensis TaxID=980011 RepID=UPI004049B7C4
MGANTSLLSTETTSNGSKTSAEVNLGDIPENCIAHVLSYLQPPEICKLARINRAFRAASSADFIWIDKLPANYHHLVGKLVVDDDKKKLGVKEMFSRLSRPVLFDGGNKEFWMDKISGGVCVSIYSKALTITGIDDRRYWNHIPSDESRFPTVAYLKQIWWVEVDGDVEFPLPAGTYTLLFKLRLGKIIKRNGRRVCNTDDVHGWGVKPVELKLATSNGQQSVSKQFLETTGKWEYHRVGEFVVYESNTPTKVKFTLTQIDCTHTKGGLAIDSVFICPTNLAQGFKNLL